MRFQLEYIDYNNEHSKNKSISLLEVFLNFHILENFYGWAYECVFVKISTNAPRTEKEVFKKYLDQYAQVKVNGSFIDNWQCNLHDFNSGFQLIKKAVFRLGTIAPKEKDYNAQQLLADLTQLEKNLPQTEDGLLKLYAEKQEMEYSLQIKRVNGYLNASKNNPQPLTRKLVGIRTYDHFGNYDLMPYRYMYDEIFSTLLRNENILTPYYKEIYFGIAQTINEAKRNSPLLIRYWCKYTYATLDLVIYNNCTDNEKEKMVLQSICDGLRLIAEIDHLEIDKIEKVIAHAKKDGVNTVLTYGAIENSTYKVEIKYKVLPNHRPPVPFYLQLTNKKNGQYNTIFINNFSLLWAAYSFKKIVITKNEIIIKGGGGERGRISREMDALPDEHRFLISSILNGN